jgi:hypothetical protein
MTNFNKNLELGISQKSVITRVMRRSQGSECEMFRQLGHVGEGNEAADFPTC